MATTPRQSNGDRYTIQQGAALERWELHNWIRHTWWSETGRSLPFEVNGRTYVLIEGVIHRGKA